MLSKYLEKNKISPEAKQKLELLLISNHTDITISEGGRLSKKTILNNEKIINDLFGANAANKIVKNLEEHLKRKKVDESLIEGKPKEVKPEKKIREPIEAIVDGKKLKL